MTKLVKEDLTDVGVHIGFDDAIHISSSGIMLQNQLGFDTKSLLDKEVSNKAHRDFIQLIYKNTKWGQYALKPLKDILIADNACYSSGKLQMIFSSDGIFEELQIINNKLWTNSDHCITINGVISAVLLNNFTKNKIPKFYPARIGGRPNGMNNVWINSFAENDYQEIESDTPIADMRRDIIHSSDIHLEKFDLTGFHARIDGNENQYTDVHKYCEYLQQVALDFGEIR